MKIEKNALLVVLALSTLELAQIKGGAEGTPVKTGTTTTTTTTTTSNTSTPKSVWQYLFG